MKKIYFIIILFIYPLLSEQSDWATTRFEKYWQQSFNKMIFRDPVNFSPYSIKIGYYNYGGKNFFSKLGLNPFTPDEMGENPFVSTNDISNGFLNNLDDLSYRRMIALELDLLKKNFFYKKRNGIDIQFGFGYKFLQSVNEIQFYDDSKLKPEVHQFNINSTFIFQKTPNNYRYILYSLGHNEATFYKLISSGDEASGSGLDQSLALGINFIIPKNEKKHDLHCGLELKFSKCNIDNISEPNNLDRIDSFNMEAVGLSFTFGIGNGGKSTEADKAYLNMVNRNYALAIEQFETYKNREVFYREVEIDSMLSFCYQQSRYIDYENAIEKYNNGQLMESAKLLNEINCLDDYELRSKIESRLYTIADQLLYNFSNKRKEYSIEYQIYYLQEINNISSLIAKYVDKQLSEVYLDKGNLLLESGDYEEAYEFYMLANKLNYVNPERIKIKIDNLIVAILNDVYNLLQNKENLIAYEKLFFAKDISSINSENIDFFMTFVESRIADINADKIRERIINIVKEKQDFVVFSSNEDIQFGDSYEDVINILGEPENKITRSEFDNNYMLLIYSINNVDYNIFFKNKILIDVERN
jgi:hypothetical protein